MSKLKLNLIISVLLALVLLMSSCDIGNVSNPGKDDATDQPSQTTPGDDSSGNINGECPHKFGEWEVVLESTCTQKGKQVRVCSLCMHIENSDIDLKAHTIETLEKIEPTCKTEGKTGGEKCSVCQTVLKAQETIATIAHNYVEGNCTMCGEKDENYTPIQSSSDGLIYVLSEDKSYYIVNGMADSTNLHILIPSTYNGLPVKKIADYAFEDCVFESIELENGVEYIGEWAFLRCKYLKKITFPASLCYIGDSAFNVTEIAEVHISDLTSWCKLSSRASNNLYNENTYLYVNGTELTNLVFPDEVTTITESFAGLNTLQSVVMHERIESIPNAAFFGCGGLAEITLSNSIKSIGSQAFEYCSSLKTIYFEGTEAEWNSIKKFSYWDSDTGAYVIEFRDAEASEKEYSVVFKDYDGTVLKIEVVDINTSATPPEDPTRCGYEFIGWDKSFTNVTSDITVTAIYEKISIEPQFIVSSNDAKRGDTIEVSVALKNNPGIASIILSVAFDSDALTLTEVIYNSSIGGQTVQPQNMNSPVKLYWINGFADAEGDFVLATLKFTVKSDATVGDHDITLSYNADDIYDISETNLPFGIVNGKVTVKQ